MAKETLKVARENWSSYAYDRDNGHLDFVKKADLCDRFFQGLQWEEKVRKRLEQQRKPVLTINKTLATLNTVMGEQINNRMDVAFKPFQEGNSETATALSKVFLSIANHNRLHWKESEVFDDGVITSRGYFDVRMRFDAQMQGDVEISVHNPKNVVVEADADKYDPETWKRVTVTKWMSIDDIERNYPGANVKVLKQLDSSGFDLGYDSIDDWDDSFAGPTSTRNGEKPPNAKRVRVIERQYRKTKNTQFYVNPRTGDTRPVPLNWTKRRVAKTAQIMGWEIITKPSQRIRWTVTADREVLFDDWSPYEHFTIVPYFPYFRRGATMGLVEHLISPQEILNKTSSQELHVVNASANGGWKVKTGSLKNMDVDELENRGAETGLILELNDVGDADKIQPNQIPTGLDRITYKVDEFIKEVSGVSDSARGFDREDVAAKAIKAKQAAGSLNLAKPMDNLVRTRYLLARNILCLIQRYYTEERVLQITTDTPGAQTEEITINQTMPDGSILNDLTIGQYEVVISSVPTRESYMDTQFEEIKAMREMGIQIPDHHVILNSHLAKKNEIVEDMQDDAAAQQAAQLAELEIQEKQADVMGKQAEAQRKGAETGLAQARAQKTLVDGQKTQVDTEIAAQQAQQPQQEMTLEQQKLMMEMQLKQWEMEAEMQLKREQMAMEMALKREEMKQNRILKIAEAEERMQQAANAPQPQRTQ